MTSTDIILLNSISPSCNSNASKTGWTMFWIYMVLLNIFPTNMKKKCESCNIWHPTLWCQGFSLYIMDKYALEDVASQVHTIHKWSSLKKNKKNLHSSLNTTEVHSILQVTLLWHYWKSAWRCCVGGILAWPLSCCKETIPCLHIQPYVLFWLPITALTILVSNGTMWLFRTLFLFI